MKKPKTKTAVNIRSALESACTAAKIEHSDKLAALTIEDSINQREQQIKNALNEIVDTIEKYFTIAPFLWIEGDEGGLGDKCFPEPKTPYNRFYKWADHWMGQLFPEAHEAQRKLDDGTDNGDEPGELAFAAQRFGFLCGVLVGSKNMGATREQLLKQCDGFILPTMQWERRRITEEAAKKGEAS